MGFRGALLPLPRLHFLYSPSFSLRAVRLKPTMTSPSIAVVGVACAPRPINSSKNRWSSAMFFSVNFTPLWDRNSVSRWQEDHPGCVYTTTFISAMLVSSLLVCAVSRRPTCLAAGQPTHKGYPAPSSGVHRHA